MLKYYINIVFLSVFVSVSAQQNHFLLKKDSIDVPISKAPIKIRFGWDIGKYIWAKLNQSKTIDAYLTTAIHKNYKLTLEGGVENHLTEHALLSYYTKGTYFKIGGDYNLYDNWLNMDNEINIGLRYASSGFEYLLTRYIINQPGAIYPPENIYLKKEIKNLSSNWLEISVNLQVEVLNNIYLGYGTSVKYLLTYTNLPDFKISYIPGFFNRNSYSRLGFGMQYFISYQLKL